jgi:predicted ester cyclase
MSSLEENKAIIRRYREIHNSGNLAVLDSIVAQDVISHNALPGLPPGLEGGKMAHQAFLATAPDLQTRTDHLVAEGDKVVEWYTATGTNTGSFMGMPPTGKSYEITSVVLYRIAGGKIVETWGLNDQFGLMQQLGMMPAPG